MRLLALFALTTLAAVSPARGLETPWLAGDQADTRLLADRSKTAIRAGVEVNLKPGWKTYWRYPGDAGVPPRFDWTGSDNLAAVDVKWPAPDRFVDDNGAKSIGYHGHIVFPLTVRPLDPARPVRLKLKFDFAVCEKLCVPADAEIALEVPAGESSPLAMLDAAEKRVPQRASLGENVGGLTITRVRLERGAAAQAIVEASAPGTSFDLFAEGPDERWALPLPEKIESKGGKSKFRLVIDGAPPNGPTIPRKIVLTLVAGDKAIEVEAPLD